MQCLRRSRPVSFAGRMLVAIALLASAFCHAGAETPDELLQRGDFLKTANNSEFQTIVKQLDEEAGELSPTQRGFLDCLHAWQLGYLGQFADAVSAFQVLLARTQDPTVRARALISLLNNQVNAVHYEDAYANLNALLDSLPQVENRTARLLSLTVTATLYTEAGQYDLALRYIDMALAYDHDDRATCIAMTQKADALVKSAKLRADDAQILGGLSACQRIGDTLYTNLIRVYQAQALIKADRNAEALQLLQAHDAEMLGDAALKRVVEACQVHLHSIDIFGRLGGEEFAILLPDCSQATAAQRADEMREAIAGSRRSGDAAADVLVTASLGVTSTRVSGYNLPTLLAQADSAMYTAKNAGRNRVATKQASLAESANA